MYKLLFKVKIGLLLLLSENKEKFLYMLACTIFIMEPANTSTSRLHGLILEPFLTTSVPCEHYYG